MKTCNVEGCEEKHLAKGYCRKHYLRLYKNDSLESSVMRGVATIERVLSRIEYSMTGCWVFLGCKTERGYGHVRDRGKMRMAHIISYEHFIGQIPEGKELDHVCRNRPCVNPAHLEPVTHQENVRRGLAGHDFASRVRDQFGRFT